MCRFITAVLPAGTDLPKMSAIAAQYGRILQPLTNASVQAQLRPGEIHCLTTSGHCDCDCAVGRFHGDRASPDREARKLRRKGWSETKLGRALQQQEDAAGGKAAATWSQAQPELRRWHEFLQELLDALPHVGLLLHEYHGPLDEEVRLRDRSAIALAHVDEAWLGGLEEDVLYEVRR